MKFALLLTLFFIYNLAYTQETAPGVKRPRTPDDYQVRTIKDLAIASDDPDGRGNKEETMIVHPALLPSRVRVTYTGSSREALGIKKEVLRQWARLYAGSPEGYTKPYQKEMLFLEGEKKYWLAVRDDALARIRNELKQGEEVDLYLIRVGAAKVAEEWELMLLVENFRTIE
ncbi:MAG TPA: hypothetical protein VIB00_13455 [Pyrinomonadaceae bacterium]|jgi:hypothetical protein